MELVVDPGGAVRTVYSEAIDLSTLGRLHISRASHVEPDGSGCWWADMSPVGGLVLGPFDHRSDALDAEITWLRVNWLLPRVPGTRSNSETSVQTLISRHSPD